MVALNFPIDRNPTHLKNYTYYLHCVTKLPATGKSIPKKQLVERNVAFNQNASNLGRWTQCLPKTISQDSAWP